MVFLFNNGGQILFMMTYLLKTIVRNTTTS